MTYLDYAATCPKVKYSSSAYGTFLNPNANYAYKEKRLLSEAEDRVKKAIGAKGGKVVFGGTSSQLIENLFTHIYDETNEYLTICSVYEHDSVWRFADQWGNIDSLKHAIQTYHGGKQLIVCLMGVNNLTGEIFPVEEIGKLCHEHNAFYICDMTAMIGKIPIPANIDQWCDCAVWSGHKLGTELGIGAMWVSDRLDKWLDGFKLHGTPNLAGTLAMTQAVEDACDKEALIERDIKWFNLVSELGDKLYRANIKCGNKYGRGKISKRWLKFIEPTCDICVGDKCCDIMKKNPAKRFEHESGLHPYIGTMTEESAQRQSNWLKFGCNSFDKDRPTSNPMSFWSKSDVLHCLAKYNIPYVKEIYGDIVCENGVYTTTKQKRTGCIFCGFGCHLEKEPNKFQTLAVLEPKLYDYCMRGGKYDESGKWVPDKGLGMAKVLDFINVKWWNDGDEAKRDEYRIKYKEKEK